MPKNLTDLALRKLPLPASGTITYWDATVKGLGVRVSPKGTKTFIALIGSGARHKIGRYPLISLADAREEAKRQLAKKTLGSYEKPDTTTYGKAVDAYLAACKEKNRPRTVVEYTRHLSYLPFNARRLHSIRKRDVAAALETVQSASERAHALTGIKVFFNWCANEGYIDASPVSALKSPSGRVQKPKRVLSPSELRTLLQRALSGSDSYFRIVALLALTDQRRGEIASLEWDRITDETMTIPAEIAKNHLEHTIPYGTLARQVLDSITLREEKYVFPAAREHVRGKQTTYFNGWSKAKAAFDEGLENVAPYKLHDLRRTFATTLQSLGVQLEVREKLLNHISGTQAGVAGVYNRYGYEKEMREAIAAYDAYLVQLLRSGKT